MQRKTEVQENEVITSCKYKQITKRTFNDTRTIGGNTLCKSGSSFEVGTKHYIVENNTTVSQAVKAFGISKSTVHTVVTK